MKFKHPISEKKVNKPVRDYSTPLNDGVEKCKARVEAGLKCYCNEVCNCRTCDSKHKCTESRNCISKKKCKTCSNFKECL